VLLWFELIVDTLANEDWFFSSFDSFWNSSVFILHLLLLGCHFSCLLMGPVPLIVALTNTLCNPSEKTRSSFDEFPTICLYLIYAW
jgi:hypothetical protein